MNLYELKEAYENIQLLIEQGEDLEEALETIGDAIEEKADGYAKIIKNMTSDLVGIKEEKKRLSERQTALENGVARLKENLQAAMIACDKKKFKTELFSFNIQKNGGKLPLIMDVETSKLPDNLVIVDEKPDNEKLRDLIEKAGDCTYAHLGEASESLRIK